MTFTRKLLALSAVYSFLFCASVGGSYAATINAASASYSDVSSAILKANYGDTVTIPPGTATWNSGISFSKYITIQGAGIDITVIISNTSSTIFKYTADATSLAAEAEGGYLRITGMTIDANNQGQAFYIGTAENPKYPNNRVSKFRIDHIKFIDGGGSYGIHVDENSRGLFDHCEFVNGIKAMRIEGQYWFSRDQDGKGLATDNAVYIEDSKFTNTESEVNIISSQDGQSGWVIRFCEFNLVTSFWPVLDMHGNNNATVDYSSCPPAPYNPKCDEIIPDEYDDCGSGGRSVGSIEIYRNTFKGTGGGRILDQRGETAMVFDNSMVLGSASFQVRDRETGAWCQANPDECDIIKNSYYFNNTNNGTEINPTPLMNIENYNPIYADVNWWEYKPEFNGKSGVGRGTYAKMQAITICTEGVGFWVTDRGNWNTKGEDGVLYRFNNNTWVEYYQPYTYPHPLTTGLTTAPNSPQNLRILE